MALQDTVTNPPHAAPTPFFPAGSHPTSQDVDQMINSRIAAAFEELRTEANRKQSKSNVYKAVGIGVGGFAVGVGGTMLIGKLVRRSRARAAQMK